MTREPLYLESGSPAPPLANIASGLDNLSSTPSSSRLQMETTIGTELAGNGAITHIVDSGMEDGEEAAACGTPSTLYTLCKLNPLD